MKKVKEFFKKLGAYIKNTAWIQPILIVIVIFVVLFSLNPLTNAIKKGWTSLTSVNKMETITYKEYVEKVNAADEDFVVVFTTKGDETCADLYDSMNKYLKSDAYKTADFKVYHVSLATKSSKKEINGKKYEQYKDSTIGLATSGTEANDDILALDALRALDNRIWQFVSDGFGENYSGLTETGENYKYISVPLFIWYQDGMETRISNTWSASAYGSVPKFNQFITEFEVEGYEADNWNEEFDLKPVE